MLTDEEFDQWCLDMEFSERTKKFIQSIRTSPPVRRVKSAAGNVSGRYPSRKMGMTIQFESHKLELPAIYEFEHDPDVLAYYDQPLKMKLNYVAKDGKRRVGFLHTPDFFVIRRHWGGFLECKYDDELEKLAVEMPNRYLFCKDDGTWSCPPGEGYSTSYQLGYSMYISSQIDWIYQRNMHFLEDYLHPDTPPVPDDVRAAIQTEVMKCPGITLNDLLGEKEKGWADAIYCSIVLDHVYADLFASPLPDPDHVHVFMDSATAKACSTLSVGSVAGPRPQVLRLQVGSTFVWDGNPWTVLNVGAVHTTVRSDKNKVVEVPHQAMEEMLQQGKLNGLEAASFEEACGNIDDPFTFASVDALKEANRRLAMIDTMIGARHSTASDTGAASKSARTIQRYLHRFRRAELRYGRGLSGLVSRVEARGNRHKKLPQETEDLMDAFICSDYETVKQQRMYEVYQLFRLKAEEAGLSVIPSLKTFRIRIKRRPTHEQTLKRDGRRAANAVEPWYWELDFTIPRHGDRQLEIGHIDHTQLDIELVNRRTGKKMGKPWLTVLMDAHTRQILAMFLTFDRPSYRSCMMVLRECVWRYGRLPSTLVVDGGPEFQSIYFETLTAYYGVTVKTRPWAKPHYGSVCERLFGTANTQFVHNLVGNTQIMKRVRQVTKSIQPRELAIWNISNLYEHLCVWADEVYNKSEHSALGQSPAEAFAMAVATSGERAHLRYDKNFRFLSLASTRKGTAKVQSNRGVRINYIYYNSRFLALPDVPKSIVSVRYDPYNVGIAYAFVKGEWITLKSECYLQLRGHTEREIQFASAELRKQNQNHGRRVAVTAKRLAAFLAAIKNYETINLQREHDLEGRLILERMGGYLMASREESDVVDVGEPDQVEATGSPEPVPQTEPLSDNRETPDAAPEVDIDADENADDAEDLDLDNLQEYGEFN